MKVLKKTLLKSDKPTVVDFWAEWCGPCKQIGPILEEISDEMKDQIVIAKHNIDNEPNTPTKFGVKRNSNNAYFLKDGELKSYQSWSHQLNPILLDWIKENI